MELNQDKSSLLSYTNFVIFVSVFREVDFEKWDFMNGTNIFENKFWDDWFCKHNINPRVASLCKNTGNYGTNKVCRSDSCYICWKSLDAIDSTTNTAFSNKISRVELSRGGASLSHFLQSRNYLSCSNMNMLGTKILTDRIVYQDAFKNFDEKKWAKKQFCCRTR